MRWRHAYQSATEQHAAQVRLGPLGQLEHYVAGLPCPGVTPGDERAALRVVWNHAFGPWVADAEIFERPDDYDLGRDTSQMLSFGMGTHFCMGASLTRLEARVALEEWWRRFPNYQVRPDGLVRVHSVNVRGFAHLPVETT